MKKNVIKMFEQKAYFGLFTLSTHFREIFGNGKVKGKIFLSNKNLVVGEDEPSRKKFKDSGAGHSDNKLAVSISVHSSDVSRHKCVINSDVECLFLEPAVDTASEEYPFGIAVVIRARTTADYCCNTERNGSNRY